MATDETYIFEALEADPEAAHAANMARLSELLLGWVEKANATEVLLSRAKAQGDAALIAFASDVLASILIEVARVAGVERHLPSPAAGLATVRTDGAETYSLDAGATLVGYLPDESAVTLFVAAETTIPAGTTSVSGVPVQAAQDGLLATLHTPQELEPDQAHTWLTSVTLDDLSEPGSDGEEDDTYMDRSSRRLALLADQLILPEDVESFVRDIEGVGRVLVLPHVDATDPAAPVSPVERCLTVVITGPDGTAPSSGLLATVRAALKARREGNFKFFVVPPTYVPVSIELTAAVWPDALADGAARVAAAVKGWLHPSVFGGRGFGYGDGGWTDTATVRVGEVVSVADAVEGVDYIPPGLVKIGGTNADFVLAAPIAALPDPDHTTVTVHVVERQP